MRKNKQGGFTLIEMLIVVAIIAILVAVSIPVVNSALEKARVATDAANERAAKAEAVIQYLNDNINFGTADTAKFNYDAATGQLKGAGDVGGYTYGKCKDHKDDFIQVAIAKATGEVTVTWSKGGAAHNAIVEDTSSQTLNPIPGTH